MTDAAHAPAAVPPASAPAARAEKPRSLWADAIYELVRNPVFIVSALLLLLLTAVAVAPGLFTSVDPRDCDIARSRAVAAPGHPLGYDLQGCDIYSRVIHGARASMTVGILVTALVVLVGGAVGAMAGYFGGVVDSVLSRVIDIFFAIPLLLGAIALLSIMDARPLWLVVVTIAAFGWPTVARIMRGSVIQTKESDYVTAARALGASTSRILLRHILPNAIAPVIVIATISLGGYIVTEATLGLMGIGLDPARTISWGGDISAAYTSLRVRPSILFWPSLALSICVLSFMLLGDAVRDALDPKLR